MLLDSMVPFGIRKRQLLATTDQFAQLVVLAAIAFAAALAIAAIASGAPFGWPVTGASMTAFACLGALAMNSIAASNLSMARLRRFAEESRIDALTELTNRRGFEERLEVEITRATRYGHPISLLMIDVDDFKLVNDRFGHVVGDQVLKSVAAAIEQSIRTIDIAGRFGGEEFAVLLPETPLSGAVVVAERMRAAVVEGSAPTAITVSIGIAEGDYQAPSRDELLEKADAALYRAKLMGKNRVELFR
jgi:diguanylate cyclase (GGDEF)-like protein